MGSQVITGHQAHTHMQQFSIAYIIHRMVLGGWGNQRTSGKPMEIQGGHVDLCTDSNLELKIKPGTLKLEDHDDCTTVSLLLIISCLTPLT